MSSKCNQKNKRKHVLSIFAAMCIAFLAIIFLVLPANAGETEYHYADLTNYINSVKAGDGVTYNADTKTFSLKMEIDTSITVQQIQENGTDISGYHSFQYQFPKEFIIPDSEIQEQQEFYLNGVHVGNYEFVKTDEDTFLLLVHYRDEYMDDYDGETEVALKFNFDAMISSNANEEEGSINIVFREGVKLSISLDDVEYPDDETYFYDIDVEKQGSYEIKEDVLSYTVEVRSEKGTPANIQFQDTLTLPNGITVKDLSSIIVTNGDKTIEVQAGNGTDENTYHYENGVLKANLPQLEAGESYSITYQYQLDSIENGTKNKTVKNAVRVESSKDKQTVADTANVNFTIGKQLIRKSGSLVDGKGKWIIVVNEQRTDIAGTTVVDAGFASACTNSEWTRDHNIAVWNNTKNASAVEGTEFNYVLDEKGNVTGIAFLANQDTDEDGQNDSNTDRFTITYYTPIEMGTTTNTAEFHGFIEGSDEFYSVSSSVTVTPPSTSVTKNVDTNKVTYDANNNALMPWTVTLSVADTIPKGTLFFDIVRDNTSTLSDKHYMTRSQIEDAFYNQLGENSQNALLQVIDKKDFYVWVHESDIQGNGNAILTRNPSTGKFYLVNYNSLLDGTISFVDGKTADTIKYHGFGFYLSRDLEVGSYTLNYQTTGDMTGVLETQKFNNLFQRNGTSLYVDKSVNIPAHITTPAVEKFATVDGIRSDKASYEMTGKHTTFHWTVWVKPYGNEHDSITVIDTLPKGVTLEQLWTGNKIAPPTNYQIQIAEDGTLSGSRDGVSITGTLVKNADGTQTVTLVFTAGTSKPTWFQNYKTGTSQLMNIIYFCSINEEAEGYPEAGEQAQLALSNQVDVYYDKDAENGAAASNTIQATIDRTSEIKNVIDKNGTWNNKSKILSYSVEANPYGEDLVSETATLELVDELTYVQDGSITASLMMDSVKLYYATLSEDEEGNPILEKGASVDSLNWSWKIEETQRDSASGTLAVKTITVTIPDSTPVILEYNYQVTKTDDGNLDIQNSANIQGTEYEADVSGSDKDEWNNVNTGVTVEITPSYTFYKVDEKNYSIRLAGAEFTLFRYRDNQWEDTGIVLTTDKKGTISFSKKNFSATATQESYTASKLTLRNNVAYYLIETKAPKGYNLPSNPPQYYFYCEDSNSNATAQYPSGWGKEETYKTAVNMAKNSATSYVKNSRPTTDVQVAKTWTLNEELTDEHPDSLTVYLKQYAVTKSVADTLLSEDESKSLQQVLGEIMDTGENVRLVTQAKRVLNKGNAAGDQWVYTWTGLPTWDDADDESENSEAVYYYYVVEEDTESEDLNGWIGSCEVTYEQSENSDYPEQISYHWTNNKTWEIYTLPATGGKGEMLFYIIGGVLMALAVIGYVIMKRKGKRKK